MLFFILLFQSLPDVTALIEHSTPTIPEHEINSTVVKVLLGAIGYFKAESIIKSYTIRQKDRKLWLLIEYVLKNEQESVTEKEAEIISNILKGKKRPPSTPEHV